MDSNSVSPEQNAAKIYCPVFLGISLGSMVTLGREANLTRFFLPVWHYSVQSDAIFWTAAAIYAAGFTLL